MTTPHFPMKFTRATTPKDLPSLWLAKGKPLEELDEELEDPRYPTQQLDWQRKYEAWEKEERVGKHAPDPDEIAWLEQEGHAQEEITRLQPRPEATPEFLAETQKQVAQENKQRIEQAKAKAKESGDDFDPNDVPLVQVNERLHEKGFRGIAPTEPSKTTTRRKLRDEFRIPYSAIDTPNDVGS